MLLSLPLNTCDCDTNTAIVCYVVIMHRDCCECVTVALTSFRSAAWSLCAFQNCTLDFDVDLATTIHELCGNVCLSVMQLQPQDHSLVDCHLPRPLVLLM